MRERPRLTGGRRSQLEYRVIKLFLEVGRYGGVGVREIPACIGRGARLSPLIKIGDDSPFSQPWGWGRNQFFHNHRISSSWVWGPKELNTAILGVLGAWSPTGGVSRKGCRRGCRRSCRLGQGQESRDSQVFVWGRGRSPTAKSQERRGPQGICRRRLGEKRLGEEPAANNGPSGGRAAAAGTARRRHQERAPRPLHPRFVPSPSTPPPPPLPLYRRLQI